MPIIQEIDRQRVDHALVVITVPVVLRVDIAGAVVEARMSEEARQQHRRRVAAKCLAIHRRQRIEIRAMLASHQRFSRTIRLLTQGRVIKQEVEIL